MFGIGKQRLQALDAALAEVIDPAVGLSLAGSGARIRSAIDGDAATVTVTLGYRCADEAPLRAALDAMIRQQALQPGLISLQHRLQAHAPQPNVTPLARVRNIIAVGSGKGGVGKSTTAVNLALALHADGARVGVLDADVYGPSIPTLLGLSGRPDSPDGKSIVPMRAHGIEAMSIGLMVEADTPMIWRGPMATSALTQLLNETLWGGDEPLDYLIVDLPPGTGDIQLTLAQKIPVAGAVIVTTPQDIATLDARKALKMFEKVQVPVLGLIENMAMHTCRECGHVEHVFGQGGAQRMQRDYGVPVLGSLPLDIAIGRHSDAGTPIVAAEPASSAATCYVRTARRMAAELAGRPRATMAISASLVGA